jgi:competence protein ComEA
MFDSRAGRVVTYVVAAALVLVLGVRLFGGPDRPEPGRIALSGPATEPAEAEAERVWVDVAGAVRRPGLYRAPAGSRVGHVVERAGGLRGASGASVNLAAPVEDGQQIVVGEKTGAAEVANSAGEGTPPTESEPAVAADGGLSLSSATAEEIDAAAEGIGPTLAARIVEVRAQSGGFTSVEDLREVPGIGEVRFQALAQVFGGG